MNRCASYPEESDDVDRALIDSIAAIPDGSFVQGIISIVSWVGPDGANNWRPVWRFDAPVSQMVGLLHMATVEIMARTPHAITRLSEPETDE